MLGLAHNHKLAGLKEGRASLHHNRKMCFSPLSLSVSNLELNLRRVRKLEPLVKVDLQMLEAQKVQESI